MKYFSMPADFKNSTIDMYAGLNVKYPASRLLETYGQITGAGVFGSGRMVDALPEVNFDKLEKYVRYSRDREIEFNYTLNPSCFGNVEFTTAGYASIVQFLERIFNAGVTTLTVTLPSFFDIIQSSGLPFKLRASTICRISDANRARYYKRTGAHKIVVDEDITRDFEKLKNIREVFGDGVEIIVNSVCYKNCPFKMFHYNHESHCADRNDNRSIKDYYYFKCAFQKADSLRNMIKLNWIRPEDLKYYEGIGINHFKIQGRHLVLAGDPVKTLEHYFRESFEGNLLSLITLFTIPSLERYVDNKRLDGFIEAFYKDGRFCKDDCEPCGYCEKYAKRSMEPYRTEKINEYVKHMMSNNLRSLMDRLRDPAL